MKHDQKQNLRPSSFLRLSEDGGYIHTVVLSEQPAELLPHPWLDFLAVSSNLDWLALIPGVIQVLDLQIMMLWTEYPKL